MGIWDFIFGTTSNPTAEKNWCFTPDFLKDVCSTAYDYGSATVSTVRSNLDHYRQDEEARSKILQLVKIIVTHAAIEGLKTIAGYNIVNNSIKDMKVSDKQKVVLEALQAEVRRLDKELSKYRKLNEQVPKDEPIPDWPRL